MIIVIQFGQGASNPEDLTAAQQSNVTLESLQTAVYNLTQIILNMK